MGIGRRLQSAPRLLERLYRFQYWSFMALAPLLTRIGNERLQRWMRRPEEITKRWIFDCRMCGQCILHSTGMTCPMTCPKTLRNGPCGGVRANGNCEVDPEMRCVWVEAYERSQSLGKFKNDLRILQRPVDHQLEGTAAWVNLLTGADRRPLPGWSDTERESQAES